MNLATATYNEALAPTDNAICDLLAEVIDKHLPEAENKIWHAHPVWFLNGNPIVGYSKLKDSVRLMFWSGQSFEESLLRADGNFKAASVRYTEVAQVDKRHSSVGLKWHVKFSGTTRISSNAKVDLYDSNDSSSGERKARGSAARGYYSTALAY